MLYAAVFKMLFMRVCVKIVVRNIPSGLKLDFSCSVVYF